MSSQDAIVAMIGETFDDVPEDLVSIVGVALVAEMPSLASIVKHGDDACAAEDRPELSQEECVKRALHVLAMLGLEMRMSGLTTLEEYAAAPAVVGAAIPVGNAITAVKDVIAEDSNERAVVADYLRSLGVNATTANVDKIRGLMEKTVTDPAAMLPGLLGSSGIGEVDVEPVVEGSGQVQDAGAMASIKERL
jgi:hypothetical protein